MRNASLAPVGTWTPGIANIGAGGYMTGGCIADDGTLHVRCDVYNSWYKKPSDARWKGFIRAGDNIAFATVDGSSGAPWVQVGSFAEAICATNSNIMYAHITGYIYKTTDGGVTVTRTAYPQNTAALSGNWGGKRTTHEPLSVDPQNGNVVYIVATAGVKFSTDGGANWSTISTGTIPAPAASTYGSVVFDRSSAVSGGRTQGIYVLVANVGLYHSTNAGSTWTAVPSTPTSDIAHMVVHPASGVLFMLGTSAGASGQIYRYDPAAGTPWTQPAVTSCRAIACRPTDATRVVAVDGGGVLKVSNDGGQTFGGMGATQRTATDIGWHVTTNESYLSMGNIVYHPTLDRVYMFEGIGCWYMDSPPVSGQKPWVEMSAGIENIISRVVKCVPDGKVMFACMDRSFFVKPANSPLSYPSINGPAFDAATSIRFGQDVDYARDDYNYITGSTSRGAFCVSTNGGGSWDAGNAASCPVDALNNHGGGNVATSNKLNSVYCGIQPNYPMYTTDGGTTWAACVFTGAGIEMDLGFLDVYTTSRQFLTADKRNAGHFYIFNRGTEDANDAARAGLWKSTDSGATFTKIKAGRINGNVSMEKYHGILQFAPNTGDLYWTQGDGGNGIWLSTNATTTNPATFTNINALWDECYALGFGKMSPDQTYPPMLAAGTYNGTWGYYYSTDAGVTWALLTQAPGGTFDYCVSITGDPSKYGRYYLAYGNSSLARIDLLDQATAV